MTWRSSGGNGDTKTYYIYAASGNTEAGHTIGQPGGGGWIVNSFNTDTMLASVTAPPNIGPEQCHLFIQTNDQLYDDYFNVTV